MLLVQILLSIDISHKQKPKWANEICNQKHNDNQPGDSKRKHHKLLRLRSVRSLWVFVVILHKSLHPRNIKKSNKFGQSKQSNQLRPHNIFCDILKRKSSDEVKHHPTGFEVFNSYLFRVSYPLESFGVLVLGEEVENKVSAEEDHDHLIEDSHELVLSNLVGHEEDCGYTCVTNNK